MLSDIRYNNIEEVAEKIKNNGGIVSCYPADISKLQDVKSLIDYTISTYKSIDVLVDNAGIMDDFAPVEEVSNKNQDL